MKLNPYISFTLLVLASCSGDNSSEPSPNPADQREISFGIQPAEQASRADGLETYCTTFKVWVDKYSPYQEVMPGYKVSYISTKWDYAQEEGQSLKYWDPSASTYDFIAVAPAEAPVSFSSGDLKITGITPASSYLIAWGNRDMGALEDEDEIGSQLDGTAKALTSLGSAYDVVTLHFYPLLAQVEFRIYQSGEDPEFALKDFKVEFVDDGIYKEADYESQTGNYYSLATLKPKGDKIKEFYKSGADWTNIEASAADEAKSLGVIPYVPQSVKDRYIVASFASGDETIASVPLQLPLDWEPGRLYVYVLYVEPEPKEIILIDTVIEEFIYGGDIDDTHTNW